MYPFLFLFATQLVASLSVVIVPDTLFFALSQLFFLFFCLFSYSFWLKCKTHTMLSHLTMLQTNSLHPVNTSLTHSTSLTKKQLTSYETCGKPMMSNRKFKLCSNTKSKSRFAPSENKKSIKSNRNGKRPRRKNERSTVQSSFLLLTFHLPLPFLSPSPLHFASCKKKSMFLSTFSPTKGW